MDKITITDDFSQSYNELKSGLKDKYLNMLYRFIDDAREKAIKMSEPLISDDILQLTDETRELKKYVKAETKKYAPWGNFSPFVKRWKISFFILSSVNFAISTVTISLLPTLRAG